MKPIALGGQAHPFALFQAQNELAGACFSPDERSLVVNTYSPAQTLAITGPWQHLG